MPDHPSVYVQGTNWTPLSIVSGNMGSTADQEAQFPPFKVIGNIYYVGHQDAGFIPGGHIGGQYPDRHHV